MWSASDLQFAQVQLKCGPTVESHFRELSWCVPINHAQTVGTTCVDYLNPVIHHEGLMKLSLLWAILYSWFEVVPTKADYPRTHSTISLGYRVGQCLLSAQLGRLMPPQLILQCCSRPQEHGVHRHSGRGGGAAVAWSHAAAAAAYAAGSHPVHLQTPRAAHYQLHRR